MHIRRALDQEIDRESIDYWFELRAAERASPEVELLKRRWEAKQRLTPVEVAAEHGRADLKHFRDRVEHDLAERYERQLRDEGLHATPRYARVAPHAEEVAADNRALDAAGIQADDDYDGIQYAAIVEQGPSVRDPGRPKRDFTRTIDEHLTEKGGRPVEEWRRAFGSGRLSAERRAERESLRAELAPLLRELIGPPGVLKRGGYVPIPKAAIARRFKVERKPIDRLLEEQAPK